MTEVPVTMADTVCGTLTAEQAGLYTCFRASVKAEGLWKLYAKIGDATVPLGIPAPDGRCMTLSVRTANRCLPPGRLTAGILKRQDGLWSPFPGGTVCGIHLPKGMRCGRSYRFPWSPGQELPQPELLCFFRKADTEKPCLEVQFSESGCPKMWE